MKSLLSPTHMHKDMIKKVSKCGRSPFQYAKENGLTFKTGLKEILFSCPEALARSPEIYGAALPLTLAKVSESDINTMFSLIRNMPEIF